MSFFNNNEFQDADLFSGGEVPEGNYMGKIAKVELKTSSTGSKFLNCQLKLDTGASLFERLNLEHPTAGVFAKKTLAKIIKGAVANPETLNLKTLEDVAKTLTNLPVAITVKHKEKNEKGYMQYSIFYNQCSSKVTLNGSASY